MNDREPERCVTEPMPKEKRAEVSYTLTDDERAAVAWAARFAHSQRDSRDNAADYAVTLRGLLERMGAANSGDDRRSVGGEHAGSAAAPPSAASAGSVSVENTR